MNESAQNIECWMENLYNGTINNEVLFLVFEYLGHDNKVDKNDFIKNFLDNLDSKNYQLFNIIDLDNVEEVQAYKKNKNIIIFGYPRMSIYKIANINLEILLVVNPIQYSIKFNTIRELLNIDSFHNTYIKRIKINDPLEIINTNNYSVILNYLEFLFYVRVSSKRLSLFLPFNVLKSDWSKENDFLLENLKNDIHLLRGENKLTSRLANAIYKVSTLKFNDNNTKIGTFFHKHLGVKSKAFKLKTRSYPSIVKVYDLKKAKYFTIDM